jgi:glucan phosphoethanolaminetransferase (alkaline phosphatase superfamily)
MLKAILKARNLIERCGLAMPWQGYLFVLLVQAALMLTGIRLHYDISRYGIVMHLVLLTALVIAVNLATSPLFRFWFAARYLVPAGLGLLQLSLLSVYVCAAMSYHFWGCPFTVELLSGYSGYWDFVTNLTGFSQAWFKGGVLLLVAGSMAWPVALFKPHKYSGTRLGRLLLLLVLLGVLYGVTRQLWLTREILHTVYYNTAFTMAPVGLLSPSARPTPRYSATPPSYPPNPRPLVLITIDSLRSDAMQVYGNPTSNTPFINSLVASGRLQRLENAHSICTLSYCGLVGILSSRYWSQLHHTPDNLADVLYAYGYESHFLLSGDHVHFFRLRDQYGEHLKTYRDGSTQADAYMNDDLLLDRWLTELKPGEARKSFLYIHLMSVHPVGRRQQEFHAQVADPAVADHRRISGIDRGDFIQHYHDGILQADDSVRKIFVWLENHGWLKDALIIITADHGEYLGEFTRLGHGGSPYEPVIRVPLLVYDACLSQYPARSIYSQVDVAPTFLRAIGVPTPSGWSGIPLQQSTDRCAVAVNSFNVKGVVGVLNGVPLKYLESEWENAGRYLLDLRRDEQEQKAPITPEQEAQLSQLLRCAGQ